MIRSVTTAATIASTIDEAMLKNQLATIVNGVAPAEPAARVGDGDENGHGHG